MLYSDVVVRSCINHSICNDVLHTVVVCEVVSSVFKEADLGAAMVHVHSPIPGFCLEPHWGNPSSLSLISSCFFNGVSVCCSALSCVGLDTEHGRWCAFISNRRKLFQTNTAPARPSLRRRKPVRRNRASHGRPARGNRLAPFHIHGACLFTPFYAHIHSVDKHSYTLTYMVQAGIFPRTCTFMVQVSTILRTCTFMVKVSTILRTCTFLVKVSTILRTCTFMVKVVSTILFTHVWCFLLVIK